MERPGAREEYPHSLVRPPRHFVVSQPPVICPTAAMALSCSRPQHLLRRFHASAQALARADPHEHSQPSSYLGSWGEPATAAAGGGDTREAWARLERLRKGYARDVGKLRRQYAYEAQLQEAERQRKAEARAEAVRVANEERKAAKAAAAQTRAAERRAFELDFRQGLMKERAEKLELWRNKEKLKAQKKTDHRELLLKQSSIWISEDKMETKILQAILHTTPL